MAAAFAKRPVDVIITIAPPAVRAAKAATTTIPTVFFLGSDPVELKIVTNLSHRRGTSPARRHSPTRWAPTTRTVARSRPDSAAYGMIINPTNENALPTPAT